MDAGIISGDRPGVRLCNYRTIRQRIVDADVDVYFRIHHISFDRWQHTLTFQVLRRIRNMDPLSNRNLEGRGKKLAGANPISLDYK